jgi:hypothetical protein
MWRCPKCGELLDPDFDTCWRCGTGQDGTEAAGFSPEPDDPAVPDLGLEPAAAAVPVAGRSTPKRRWHQFSLRTLLLLTALVCLALSYVGIRKTLVAAQMAQTRQQREAVQAIEQLGGYVFYDYQFEGTTLADDRHPRQAEWIGEVRMVGLDSVDNLKDQDLRHLEYLPGVRWVILPRRTLDQGEERWEACPITDQGLVYIGHLSHLDNLDLTGAAVTDAGLAHLKGLRWLTFLKLGQTQVTDAGVRELQKALPGCRIER